MYKKIVFKDFVDNNPDLYLVNDNQKTIIKKDDSELIERGTLLNAENFNYMENGIYQNSIDINNAKITLKTIEGELDKKANTVYLNTELDKKINKSGGTFTGIVKSSSNEQYSNAQNRNIILSDKEADINLMKNGEIWIQYE